MSGPDPSLVRDFPFFRNLTDDDLRAILAAAKTRRIERKGLVFAQGQSAAEFFVLMHGHLKVVQIRPTEGRSSCGSSSRASFTA